MSLLHEVKCECGASLEYSCEMYGSDNVTVTVDACVDCMAEAKAEGVKKGYDDGHAEGYDEGTTQERNRAE